MSFPVGPSGGAAGVRPAGRSRAVRDFSRTPGRVRQSLIVKPSRGLRLGGPRLPPAGLAHARSRRPSGVYCGRPIGLVPTARSGGSATHLNTRFMRNGIVMLVLVAATAALLYALIQPSQAQDKSYSDFEKDVKSGNVVYHRPPGHDPHGHRPRRVTTYTVQSDSPADGEAAAIESWAPQFGTPASTTRSTSPPTPAGSCCSSSMVCRSRWSCMHLPLLHAPGAGHQQPGHELRQEPGPHVPGQQDGRHLRRRRRGRRGENGSPGGRRVPQVPREVQLPRAPASRAASCSSAPPAPARRCWPGRWPARRACPSSRSPARSSWRCSSASAPAASATCSTRPSATRPASSSSTRSTPSAASAAPAWAAPTTSASRPSTRSWSRWTASTRTPT